ncbi:MAG: GIY-YIG nuclease family protein [Fibrobacter sp.]|uniref:GIY-YIG nuclease family protein n=1 Tax=Fibrobacter sp. TaxID=35828 RepID=UPI002A9C4DC1|nr:GIY-YIG nuclease family protein [Fibrobacter sp.]
MDGTPINIKSLRPNINEMKELDNPGIYKWWAPQEKMLEILKKMNVELRAIENEIETKSIESQKLYCIYVGQAKNLKDRLKNHIGGSIRNSTLRKSLGAILWNGEDSDGLKKKINKFMDDFFVEYEQVDEFDLDRIESSEIRSRLRIFNIEGFNHESFEKYIEEPLSKLRADLKAEK